MDPSLDEPLRLAIYREVGALRNWLRLPQFRVFRETRYHGRDSLACVCVSVHDGTYYADLGYVEARADDILTGETLTIQGKTPLEALAATMANGLIRRYDDKRQKAISGA